MNFPRFRVISLSLISFVGTALCAVAQQLPEKEEDIPVEYIPTFDNTLSIGATRFKGGAKVKFGNLGVIPQAPRDYPGGRLYSNGAVYTDFANGYERDASGTVITADSSYTNFYGSTSIKAGNVVTVYSQLVAFTPPTPTTGATYVPTLDSNGAYVPQTDLASTHSYLAYTSGQTRTWSVNKASQIDTTNHTVSMSTYGASSTGATMEAEGGSSTGFELTWERRFGQLGRLEIGFSGGLSLADVNMKTSGTVVSNLLKTTDVYSMVNTGLNTVFYNGGTDADGNPISINQPTGNAQSLLLMSNTATPYQMYQYIDASTISATTALANESVVTPLDNKNYIVGADGTVDGTVLVSGSWQVKGAYYHVKLGPTLRYRFNDRWAVSGGFGVSICYVGTVFKVDEQIFDLDSSYALRSIEQNTTHKFVPGYYGDFNAEYWVSERTGFYVGVNYQKLGNYSQIPLSGRTAKIDLGTSEGWRIGIMTRF